VVPINSDVLIGVTIDGRLCKWKIENSNLSIISSEFINSSSDNLFLFHRLKLEFFYPKLIILKFMIIICSY